MFLMKEMKNPLKAGDGLQSYPRLKEHQGSVLKSSLEDLGV
jgi:hypothetical protein